MIATAGPRLVLGSASPARATLLRNAGVPTLVLPSTVDEDVLTAAGDEAGDPFILTQLLATAKAQDVAEQIRTARTRGLERLATSGQTLVVGADSLLAFDGRLLGKARTEQEIRDRWATMAGRSATLVTGHTVIDVGSRAQVERAVATTVHFGRPDDLELAAYIDSGEPFVVAGSCTIDGLGGPFIDGIEGDHTNVIGLSLPTLRSLVAALGVRWTDLWTEAAGWAQHSASPSVG